MNATYVRTGDTMEYTAAAKTLRGEVVALNCGRIGVAVDEIPAGGSGLLHLVGVFSMPKSTSEAISAGAILYYDSANAVVTGVRGNLTTVAGIAAASADSDASYIDVRLGEVTRVVAPMVHVTTHPSDASKTAGSISGSLTAAAVATDGSAVSYAWYSNSSASNSGGTAVAGATSASMTIDTTLTAGTYYYYCVATSATAGSTASDVATVTVAAA